MASSPRRWMVAAIQMTSTADRDRNLSIAGRLARRAARSGARLIALPENFSYLHSEGSPFPYRDGPRGELVGWLRSLSSDLGCWLLAGSIPERIAGSRRVHNTSLLLDPSGRLVARYRKIHLFDVDIPGKVSLKESRTVARGRKVVAASTPLGKLGLSICYDLRFPELYRRLVRAGAQVIFVPSAFTAVTGPHHWMPLLRVRALENQCWVVAPAQVGRHSPARKSHGHTMIVDPWGRVVAMKASGEGIVKAEIDLDALERIRRGLPSLRHIRPALL